MKISRELLLEIAKIGGEEVSKAFSKLSKEEVSVETAVAEVASYDTIIDSLKITNDHAIITYAQAFGDTEGLALLSMDRESALSLVDILSQKEVGTTGVLMDIDRSAVKETLNILSNSYLNYLINKLDAKIMFQEPYMMTSANITNVLSHLKGRTVEDGESIFYFKTILKINKHQIEAQLFILFNKDIVEMIINNK